MLVLLAALLATPALAHGGQSGPHRPDPLGLEVQISALQGQATPWLSGQVRLVGKKDAYVGFEGRAAADLSWTARLGAGFDLLGRSEWDLKLGLFVGGLGYGISRDRGWVTGTELALKGMIGRLYGEYRWLAGIGGTELAEMHSEHDLRIGFRIVDPVRVFGEFLTHHPTGHAATTAAGLGVAMAF